MKIDARSSTHHIQDIDGALIRKDLSVSARVKLSATRPAFMEDVGREPAAYPEVLAPLGIGPRCLRSGPDWVLIERIDAPELWQIGDIHTWVEVARWIADMHARLAVADTSRVPLLVYNADLFGAWRRRAARRGVAQVVLAAHEHASRRLLELPSMVLHGDLYASNLLVRPGPPVTVWPVDWELMSWGPTVLDLAALTSGRWGPRDRQAMVAAYIAASAQSEPASGWESAIDAARLQLCVQWLGMPARWVPPPAHTHDWGAEALELAGRFGS